MHDEMTGFYNYRYLSTRLVQEFKRAERYHEPFACVIVDIDKLRNVNDAFGRAVLTVREALGTVELGNRSRIPLEVQALSTCRRFRWAMVATIFAPAVCAALPADDGGGLVGWVESTRGVPVAGALVSIFGKGIRGGSLVTLADSQGQFVLPSLPPGSYTLRAVGQGHEPSAARE